MEKATVANRVKEKLARGEVVASMIVKLVKGVEIARLARTAGFDSLYVDIEHSSFSFETTSQICMAALEVGIAPFVRVPGLSPEYISRALDGGALGVIAPHIQTPEEAARVVAAAKFPPQGTRSFAGALPHLQYRTFPTEEMSRAMNEATMVVTMIETAKALDNVEAIAAVAGVDLLLVGTNDLCGELGIPGQLDHPRIREAYIRCIAACRKHGKHLGIGGLASKPQLAAEFVKLGARYVSTGTDLAFLLGAATARAKQVHDIVL